MSTGEVILVVAVTYVVGSIICGLILGLLLGWAEKRQRRRRP
jgi:glycerol-3-phosphate acyltransferase PlsY